MFSGRKEDFDDFIKDCEKNIEFIHNQIKRCLERQEYCKIRIQEDIFRKQFTETLKEEEEDHEALKDALINAEDFLNNLKKFSKLY